MATTFVADSSSRVAGYPPTGMRKIITGVMTTDGNDGASEDDIAASVFGLTKIEEASPAVKSTDDLIVVCAASYDGAFLVAKAAATAALADIPSGVYRITLRGY